jgi:hypothetical protein
MQSRFTPEATPDFKLIDPKDFTIESFDMPPPVFIKPVKSTFSAYANRAASYEELEKIVKSSTIPDLYLQQINWFLKHYSSFELNANYLLAETLLEGAQVTLEGYVYDGKVEIIGIVDSVMYPGTICFERFEYPSLLPLAVQERMADICRRFINGIRLDNSFFNIELMYNPQTGNVHIIEVNPRLCNQFADLYEKVDGINTYKIQIDIALGTKPVFEKCSPKYKVAASFVLRRFDDGLVKRLPTPVELASLYELYPDIRVDIWVKEGQYLHSDLQDGKSYRYGCIHLGAATRVELFAKFEHCKKTLRFEFK